MNAPSTQLPAARQADPALLALAAEVREDDWLRIDAIWERFRRKYRIHLRRDTGLDAHAFLLEAFVEARSLGLLRVLAHELLQEGLTTSRFTTRLLEVAGPSAVELHAFQNGVFRPVNALLAARDMLTACNHVCRIDVEGQQRGTGVQVSQRLVATAAHVVWDLIARQEGGSPVLRPDGSLQAADGSLSKLTVTFGDAVDYLADEDARTGRRVGEAASLHPDWLAWGSQPTDNERAEALSDVSNIDGISPEEGPWDLALIRLAAPRQTMRPVQLLTGDPPSQAFQINILHHPHGATDQGEPLLWSVGQLDRQLGAPPVRCLHDASTLRGSSGAPVFDSRWRIVALHQGGKRVMEDSREAPELAESCRNRAVPVRRWCERLSVIERSAFHDVPYLTALMNEPDLAPSPYPVIGRRETQQRVWRAMQPTAAAPHRLLIVRGEPGTGRRFTTRLIREMVTAVGGAVVTLNMANALDENAAGFAERATRALTAQLPHADSDGPPLTTLPRVIRSNLVPDLGIRLEQLAADRSTWLVLEGFDEPGIEIPATVKDLIVDLVSRLEEYRLLRLVLIGWQETPVGYEESVETLLPPTADEVAGCLVPPGELPDQKLVTMVEYFLDLHAREAMTGYPAAHQIIAELTRMLCEKLGEKFGVAGKV